MQPLNTTDLVTLVQWASRDSEDSPTTYRGAYQSITEDIGATIGVGVIHPATGELIHSFYAYTRHPKYVTEMTREYVQDTITEIRRDRGSRWIVKYFPEYFPAHVRKAGHNDLHPIHLHLKET